MTISHKRCRAQWRDETEAQRKARNRRKARRRKLREKK